MTTHRQDGCSIETSTVQSAQPSRENANIVLFEDAQSTTPKGRLERVFTVSTVTGDTTLGSAATIYLTHLRASAAIGRTRDITIKGYRYGLSFLRELEEIRLADLTRPAVLAWIDNLATVTTVKRRSPAGLEFAALRALQAMLRWCADRGACPMGIAARIPTGYQAQPGQPLSYSELYLIRAALAANDCPTRISTTRVIIQLLRILAQDGARTSEVRLAEARHFDQRNGVLRWPRGKNGKPRIIVLSDLSIRLLQARLDQTPAGLPLFANPHTGKPVSHFAVGRLLRTIAVDAGINGAETFCPHDFRHTFATLAVEAGISLEDVAAGLGHTNTSTLKSTYLHNAVAPGARRANAAVNGRAA